MCSAYSADGGVLRTEFPSVSSSVSQLSIDNWAEFPNKVLGFSAKEAQPRRLRSRQRFQTIGTTHPDNDRSSLSVASAIDDADGREARE